MHKIGLILKRIFTRQLLIYLFIGGFSAFLDYVLFLLLYDAVGLNPYFSTIISVTLGILSSFTLNTLYNFKKKNHLLKRFIIFYTIGFSGIIISIFIIYLLHNLLNLNVNLAKLISIPIIVSLQFTLNSRLSFSDKPSDLINIENFIKFIFSFIVFIIFVSNSQYFIFIDEMDNFLGGKLINQGMVPYRDFFSHHMPLTYFAGALLLFFTKSILWAKILFSTCLFIWTYCLARSIALYTKIKATFYLFLGIVALAQIPNWSHMLLAETLTVYAVMQVYVLLFFNTKPNYKRFVAALLLSSVPVLSSLGFIWISILLYIYIFWHERFHIKRIKDLCLAITFTTIPYIILLTYLFLNNSLREFYFQNYTFNKIYYSEFVPELKGSFVETTLAQFANVFNQIYLLLSDPLSGLIPFCLFSLTVLSLCAFYIRGQRLQAALGVSLIFLFALRGGINDNYSSALGGSSFHGLGYVLFALFIIILFFGQNFQHKLQNKIFNSCIGIFGIYALFLIISLSLSTSLMAYSDYSKDKNQVGASVYTESKYSPAKVTNSITLADQYYWMGPSDTYQQIYINSKPASKYMFFLPWQAKCIECEKELLLDLAQNKPSVIYWKYDEVIWENEASDYSPALNELLTRDYYQVLDPGLKYFYFIKSQQSELNIKLITNGYKL